MPAPRTITIVGGGLAGLTLGIGLRQRGIPAEIFEAGTYPRHRVCGEFISGNGPGEVPLPKLVRHVQKLGREVKPAEMTDILNRLKALDAQRSAIPLPKGPVPTSMKGMRGNLRGR